MVGTGDSISIEEFVIQGTRPKKVIVRGIGPSLAALGVPDPLADPVLSLYASSRHPHHDERQLEGYATNRDRSDWICADKRSRIRDPFNPCPRDVRDRTYWEKQSRRNGIE